MTSVKLTTCPYLKAGQFCTNILNKRYKYDVACDHKKEWRECKYCVNKREK